jgi:hypothetical protein
VDLPFTPPDSPVGPDELAEIARLVAEHPRLWEDDLSPDRTERHRVPTEAEEQLRPQGFQGDPTGAPPSRPDRAASAMA